MPDSDVNTAAHTVADLTNGTAHEFQVRAITATNRGAAASATATPMANPPTPPQDLSALHFNQSVRLSWLAPVSNGGSPIIRYEYRQRTGEADFGEWTSIPDSSTGQANELAYSVPSLTNGTNYTFEVSSVNNAAASASSNQASATPQVITTPGQPRDYAVSSGDGEVFLQWLRPAQDGGRPISGYEYCLDLADQCSASWTTVPDAAISTGGRGHLAAPSSNGAYTRAKIRAVNSQGGGTEDDLAAVPISGAPAAPADLGAETISSTQVRITWTEPQSQEGTTITSYTLEQSADGIRWNDRSQPKGSTSVIEDIGEDAVAYFRIRTGFRADSPLIISGADFSRANSPWTEIVTASTAGAEQTTAVTVSVADSYAHEGTSSDVVFDVYLNSPPEPASTISVDYQTHDHTATAGHDYTAQSGSITFSPGERAKTVSVPIIDDNLEDSGESFTLVLTNPAGAVIARARATGSIYNEESLITGFTLTNLSTNADVQAIAAGNTITLDNPADGNYSFRANPAAEAAIGSVKLELSGAHTASRTDNDRPYTLHESTGAGLPTGNYTIKATVHPDPDAGGTPHQTISTSFTIAATAQAPTSQLSAADATASEEDDSTIDFVVTLNPASDETVTVDYTTSDGTATASEDYTAQNGALTFNAGDTTKTIQISIIDDTMDDGNETLTITLSNASGADISDSTATGAIGDSDETTPPLTAEFKSMPTTHDGDTAFNFQVEFSENVAISYVNMRDDSFTVTEGEVTSARRINGRSDLWLITVRPDSSEDVGISLPANRACGAPGAICTRGDNPTQLTNSPSETVAGPTQDPPAGNHAATGAPTITGTPQVDQTLTADTSPIADEDGLTDATFKYQWNAGGSDIDGATGSGYTLTSSEQGQTIQVRVSFTDDADNQESLTSVATVAVAAAPNQGATGAPTISGTPQVEQTLTADTSGITDADGLTTVSYRYQWMADGTETAGAAGASFTLTAAEQGKTIQVRVDFEDDLGNSESLTSAATEAVAAKPIPLTATFENVPETHSGAGTEFTFRLRFSESFKLSYTVLRDHAFQVDGGKVTKAKRVNGRDDLREIHIEPDGNGTVTVTLPATTDCDDDGAICTEDGRMLSNSTSVQVAGPQ